MFTSIGYRPPTRQRVALAATRDGKLTALVHESTSQTAPFAEFDAELCMAHFCEPFTIA